MSQMTGLIVKYLCLQWQSGYSDTFPLSRTRRYRLSSGTFYQDSNVLYSLPDWTEPTRTKRGETLPWNITGSVPIAEPKLEAYQTLGRLSLAQENSRSPSRLYRMHVMLRSWPCREIGFIFYGVTNHFNPKCFHAITRRKCHLIILVELLSLIICKISFTEKAFVNKYTIYC